MIDPPTTYRSYVQCKGRARAVPAYHVVLVASDWKDLTNLATTNEQIKDRNHHLVCSLENDEDNFITDSDNSEKGEEDDDDEEDEDNQIIGISTKKKFVYGSIKGTIKILNPEVITNKPPSKPSTITSDLILKEIKDETLAIEDIQEHNMINNDVENSYVNTTNDKNSKKTVLNEGDNNTLNDSINLDESFNSNKSVIKAYDIHKVIDIDEINESNSMAESHCKKHNSDVSDKTTSSSKTNDDYTIFDIDEALKTLEIKSREIDQASNSVQKAKEKKKFVCLLNEFDESDRENSQSVVEIKQFENMDNTTNKIVQQMAEYREIEKVIRKITKNHMYTNMN